MNAIHKVTRTQQSGVFKSTLAAVALALLFIGNSPQAWGEKNDSGVIPPNAKFKGLTYGEWGAQWWSALFSIPVVDDDHPLFSGGAFAMENGVLFLAGVGGVTTIDITIPDGTPIFFPLVNTECSALEGNGNSEAELRACANSSIDQTSGLFAMIDGLPVQRLQKYRVESPLFEFALPEDNLFEYFGLDAPAETTSLAVDAGVYLLLAPLSVGQHTVRFGGTFENFGFSIDTTYNITVVETE